MRQEVSLITQPKNAVPGQGTLHHVMVGYDAGTFFYIVNLVL